MSRNTKRSSTDDSQMMSKGRRLGINPNGMRQALNGQVISRPDDRDAVANILKVACGSEAILVGILPPVVQAPN